MTLRVKLKKDALIHSLGEMDKDAAPLQPEYYQTVFVPSGTSQPPRILLCPGGKGTQFTPRGSTLRRLRSEWGCIHCVYQRSEHLSRLKYDS
jgi:hypothetical protein